MDIRQIIAAVPENLVVLEGDRLLSLHHLLTPPHLDTLIHNPKNQRHLWQLLSAEYPQDYIIEVIERDVAGTHAERTRQITLSDLREGDQIKDAIALHIPPLPEERSFEFFQNVVATLRAPDGCPWDRKQTHQSLRDDFLQEVYELLSGLDDLNLDTISEELGDVLLHVVIQAQIALDAGEFNLGDVVNHISRKLIFRHPHVFDHAEKLTSDEVLDRWERVKKAERAGQKKEQGLLDGISTAMPALSMAFSYQKRAAKAGFDWDSVDGVWGKLNEEIEEFRKAETDAEKTDELGDILFTLVNLARWEKVDPETALRMANRKFYHRVQYVEAQAKLIGKDLFDMPLEEKDRYWDAYKATE